jgi:hypothetical protein
METLCVFGALEALMLVRHAWLGGIQKPDDVTTRQGVFLYGADIQAMRE